MRDTPEQRYDEKWKRDHEDTQAPMLRVELGKTLEGIWKMYRRQKDAEADAGRDVNDDLARMRAVFTLALNHELSDDEIERRFPERAKPGAGCHRCGGEGWYYSYKARVGSRAREQPRAKGMVVCDCPAGRKKNNAIRNHGKIDKRKKSV